MMILKIVLVFIQLAVVTYCAESSSLQLNGSSTNRTRHVQSICPRKPAHLQIVSFWCTIVFIPITIFGNLLVVMVIFSTRCLRQQHMYLSLSSLAVADLLVGLITFPMYAKLQWDAYCFELPFFMCWTFFFIEVTLSLTSSIHLFAIAVDRYIALRFTYEYNSGMTRTRSLLAIASIWIFSIFWASLFVFRWDAPSELSISRGLMGCFMTNMYYFKVTYYVIFILPVFMMALIYLSIYHTAIRHVNEIAKLQIRDSASTTEHIRRQKQAKLIRSIVVVFTAYFVCWLPLIIFALIMFDHVTLLQNEKYDWFKVIQFIVTDFLPHFSSTLNPFIYVLTNKAFMMALSTKFTSITGINCTSQTHSADISKGSERPMTLKRDGCSLQARN